MKYLIILKFLMIFSACNFSNQPINAKRSPTQNSTTQVTQTPAASQGTPISREAGLNQPNGGNPPYGDATGSSTTLCNSTPGTGDQEYPYYRLPIIGNGLIGGGVMWSSTNLTNGVNWSQNIFKTDSRLHVRVKVKPNPTRCPLPANLTGLNFDQPYSKLQLIVAIRPTNYASGSFFEKIIFTDVKVNECSPVRAFADIPVSNDPLIVEILNVKSDYYCKLYTKDNHTGDQQITGSQYCPYTWVDGKACWEIELHVATDDTKDIPR